MGLADSGGRQSAGKHWVAPYNLFLRRFVSPYPYPYPYLDLYLGRITEEVEDFLKTSLLKTSLHTRVVTTPGEPVVCEELTVVPVSRTRLLHLGWGQAGVFFERSRASRLDLQGPDGPQSVTVPDKDLQIRLVIWAVVIACLCCLRFARR